MSKEQMLIARELIKEKKYAEARAILESINHPKAQEWLAKLDAMAPSAKPVATPRPAKPKPSIDESDPDAFLDELMARKRPAQRRPTAPKAAAKKNKKPGFRYFLVYGLIFIIFLGGMLYGAITFLESEDDPPPQTADHIDDVGPDISDAFEATGTADAAATATAESLAGSNGENGDFPEAESNPTPDPSVTEEP